MRKIFTSLSMALCLLAPSFTISAQTTKLNAAQKEAIQKELLPVIFEQVKQETGLDILKLAQPELKSESLTNFPLPTQSGLRADTPTPFKVKPDSIVINVAAIEGISPEIAGLLGNLKLTFEDYNTTEIPLIGDMLLGRGIQIEMPSVIKAVSPTIGTLAEIKITTTSEKPDELPKTTDITIALLGGDPSPLLTIIMAQNAETYALEFGLTIGQGLKDILSLVDPEIVFPDVNYLVTIDLMGFFMPEGLPLALYAVPAAAPTMRIPMGVANLVLDFSATIPVKAIGLTSYEEGVAKGWRKLWFKMEQKNQQDLVMNINNYVYGSEAKTDSTFANATIITMSDYTTGMTMSDPKSAVTSVFNRVATELATEGKATWYKMLIEGGRDLNGDGAIQADEKAPVMDIQVTPYTSGTNAIAEISIKSFENGVVTSEMNVNATADMTSESVKMEIIPAGSPAAIASMYFKSNAFGIITDNDNISASASVEVVSVNNGLQIANCENATYQIVGINGAIVANGRISGNNAYISTASLVKGVYVIVLTENGVSQSVKFIR